MCPKDTKHYNKGVNMGNEELCLPYNKYGEWLDDMWIPYDDMEEMS